MLNPKMIKEQIAATTELKEVTVVILDTKAFVKKFSRRESTQFGPDVDTVASMVFAGVTDDKGVQVFESIEQVMDLSSGIVNELFMHVNKYNTESVEKQAKK